MMASEQADELSGGDGTRSRRVAIATASVLLVAGIAVAHAGQSPHPKTHRTALPPAPAPVAETKRPHLGSVFLQHLPECTRTDHRHALTVALAVTNLGGKQLSLVGASGVSSNVFAVRAVQARIGDPPCGSVPATHGRSAGRPVRLAPAGVAVVRLSFYVARCPGAALVSARIAFDGGSGGPVHADSSELANLSQLEFTSC